MNLIERAGKQLGRGPAKSLIEKAADRISREEPAPAAAESVAVAAAPTIEARQARASAFADSRRETRRQVTLDFERLRTAGFVLPGDQTSMAEEFRIVKRPLMNAALAGLESGSGNANVFMVTSAGPNEGKTYVAINLAFSIASEHEIHVLLIDADVAKPSIPQRLGFEADVGLIDVVSDSSIDLADVMVRTSIENLSILPSGLSRPGSSELLASARMSRFAEEIAKRYPDRIIIFDSPPVLARSEPIVLAKHVGQVVFVVEAERTSRTAIEEAVGLIGPERIAGIVLNKAPKMSANQGFGYYGYYSR